MVMAYFFGVTLCTKHLTASSSESKLTQMSIDVVNGSDDVKTTNTRQHRQNRLDFGRPQCKSVDVVHDQKHMTYVCTSTSHNFKNQGIYSYDKLNSNTG